MKLRLSPLPDADNGSYGFGAQVHGVDVAAVAQQASGGEDGGIRATMLQAMREHGLLLFRGQKELEPEEQLAFAKIFPWDMTASPDRLSLQSRHGQAFIPAVPEVVVQGHGVVPAGHYGLPAGELRQTQDHWQWHADGLHQLITPPVHTQMYCTVAPERGGATGFVSAHEAWDRLPPRLKSKASGLRARYQTVAHPMSVPPKASERGAYGGAAGQWSPAVSDTMDIVSSNADEAAVEAMEAVTKLATEVPWSKDGDQRVIHPVIQVHPGNGRLALVAVPMFTHSFEGMDVAESHTLLGELMRTGVGGPRGARIYQHSWRRGDLVAWDNRSVLHSATPVSEVVGTRLFHRVRLTGPHQPVEPDEPHAHL